MARTIFYTDSTGNVTMTAIDDLGNRTTRVFTCPVGGGYVREGERQVCERLSKTGRTLQCGQRADLINLIRREHRAMRAAEKREIARRGY